MSKIRPLTTGRRMQTLDLNVFCEVRLMGGLDDTAFTDFYREGPPPPGGHKEPSSVGGREDPRPPVTSGVGDERTTSGRGARREIVSYTGDARCSGGHRCKYGRPAAGISRTVTRATSRFLRATAKLCDRSTLAFRRTRRGGRFVDCWTRGPLRRYCNQRKTSSTRSGCTTRRQVSTVGPRRLQRRLHRGGIRK